MAVYGRILHLQRALPNISAIKPMPTGVVMFLHWRKRGAVLPGLVIIVLVNIDRSTALLRSVGQLLGLERFQE